MLAAWGEMLMVNSAKSGCGCKVYLAEGFDGTVFEIFEEGVEKSAASTAG